ncbi:MAG: response regulator [Myxococcales bacterium]|nr:response regulator [Myxococcales bacterium]
MVGRILIVEDDQSISRSLSLFLKHKGYEVECAENGLEGLRLLQNKTFDIVVSDVMMPQMNGLQLLEAIKETHPTLPVVMITGYTDLNTAIETLKKGAADFVTKPFRYDQFEQTIHHLLENEKAAARPIQTVDLQARLERKIRELSVLYMISEELESSASADDLFIALTEVACNITEAARSSFFMYDRDESRYYLKQAFNLDQRENRPLSFQFPTDINESLQIQRIPLAWNDPEETAFYRQALNLAAPINQLILAPLYVRGENFGVLAVEEKVQHPEFTAIDLNFIKFLLKKASLQIENSALYETIYANLVATLRSLVSTLEAKDTYTQRHSDRVTKISLLVAKEVGCSKEELDILQFAGMLHDIGKIGISDAILQKKGRLTDEEYEIIKQHPVIGARILEPLGMLPHEKAIIRHHHERWDGKGYPDGLAGRDIPFLARIVSLADAYDAMTSDRVYRKGLSHEVAVSEIKRNAWYQFDGNLSRAFLEMCERSGDEITNLLA